MKLCDPLVLPLLVLLAPCQLTAQTETVDLSGHTLETVISAGFDGGSFARIDAIFVSDQGIWVADSGEMRVLRFDLEGRLMSAYGRDGDGAGEFPRPRVIDLGPNPVVRFATDAGHPASRRHDPGSDPLSDVLLFHPDGRGMDTAPNYHIEAGRWISHDRPGDDFGSPLRESRAWTSVGDSMAVLVDGNTGMLRRLTVRNGSVMADTFGLAIPVRHASSVRPEATRVLVGRNDEIWVRSAAKGRHEEWDIVEPGAHRRWRVVFPQRFQMKAVYDGHLYGVLKDDLGVPSVVRVAEPPR